MGLLVEGKTKTRNSELAAPACVQIPTKLKWVECCLVKSVRNFLKLARPREWSAWERFGMVTQAE